jgi:RNA polymerase sigma-70 factor (ECF subfamily)
MRDALTAESETPPRDGETEPDDRELVRRSQQGDSSAFGALIRRYQKRIFGLGFRTFRSAEDADDLVQETFLRAWRAIDRFDVERPVAPWLLRIAVNWSRSELASRKRRPAEELTEAIPQDGPSPEEDAERARLGRRIERAVEELPEDQRMILILRASEGLSYREISDLCDVPIGTVMSRLARARETLRRRIER